MSEAALKAWAAKNSPFRGVFGVRYNVVAVNAAGMHSGHLLGACVDSLEEAEVHAKRYRDSLPLVNEGRKRNGFPPLRQVDYMVVEV
jgi:hypothetical protein